jgi:hypothetical protein
MPKTLAGFLLVAGTAMFVLSLLKGNFKVKEVELPLPQGRGRFAFGGLGVVFLVLAAIFYWSQIFSGDQGIEKPLPTLFKPTTTEIREATPPAAPVSEIYMIEKRLKDFGKVLFEAKPEAEVTKYVQ